MAIVQMKRLQMIVPYADTRRLLKSLTREGCFEVERNDEWMSDADLSNLFIHRENEGVNSRQLGEITQALDGLKKYAGVKKGLMQARTPVNEETISTEEVDEKAAQDAAAINEATHQIYVLNSENNRLDIQKASLLPWQSMDVPVDFKGLGLFFVRFGTLPVTFNFDEVKAAVEAEEAPAELELIAVDKEFSCVMLTVHRDYAEEAYSILKPYGYTGVSFSGLSGTPQECIKAIEEKKENIAKQQEELVETISGYASSFEALGKAYDRLTMQTKWDEVQSAAPSTRGTSLISGWIPAEKEECFAQIAEECGCAYEISDPGEDDTPPTCLKNSRLVEPFSQVTQLYGMPTYDSLIDPNPVVALSYFIFFGIMFSDTVYGAILALACLIFIKKARPDGSMKKFISMFGLCGISTAIFGMALGSWCGDFIPVLTERISGTAWTPPFLIDPLENPMLVLILSLSLGVIHLYTGMVLGIVRKAKRGEIASIIFDDLTWMLLIPSLVLGLLVSSAFIYVAAGCLLVILCTAGREKKGLGKLTGGLGAIYNGLTGNLSDILSYARLMALAMSTGVIAQVMNTLAGMGGTKFIGWIFFIIVFTVGQVFNFAISILGAFVHSCRLQFVELFGRFYEGGGRLFSPLFYKTKYAEIIKEEN